VFRAGEVRREDFLYELKAGPAGGRLWRPSSRRQPHDGHRTAGLTLSVGGPEAVARCRRSLHGGRKDQELNQAPLGLVLLRMAPSATVSIGPGNAWLPRLPRRLVNQ
jgi:hypothetical protein